MSERHHFSDTEPMIETPELSPDIVAEDYERRRPDVIYPLGCGDDRPLTSASREFLTQKEQFTPNGEYLRAFGGPAGMARVLSVLVYEKGDPTIIDKLDDLGETFPELVANVARKIAEESNIRPQLHSAEKNEDDAAHFHPEGSAAVGCAYCAGVGVVGRISLSEEHGDLSKIETPQLFGTPTGERFNPAKDTFVKRYYPDPDTPGMTRTDYNTIDTSVQILAGNHAPVEETWVVENFDPELVSNPARATEAKRPYYNYDITQVAEALLRTFPEFDLDPESLLRVMDDDVRATRAALAGEAGATALKVKRIGTPQRAVDYLDSVKASH